MTFQSKIDPSLAEWMAREPGKKLPVLIEMREQPGTPPPGPHPVDGEGEQAPLPVDRDAEMDEFALHAQASRGGVIEQLHDLGVGDDEIETFTIVNAVAVTLTPDQIRTMAERSDVEFVRYNGQTDVTL